MTRFLFLLPLIFLTSCNFTDRDVTVLKCEGVYDQNFRCLKIAGKGSEMTVTVNSATQKVQLDVTEFNDNFFPGQLILDKCSVVDHNNWKCVSEVRSKPGTKPEIEVITTNGMYRGHFYSATEGAEPPHYYSSSVSGWRRWMVKAGFWNYEQAQQYD